MEMMQKIDSLSQRLQGHMDHILNEEATKNAMVMPFIQSLGYDVFDPTEVLPEFTADVGLKKGEKVDYAIKNNGVLSILIECKPRTMDLADAQFNQLYRYFNCTEAKFAILTNGVEYRFYSDLDDVNKLDNRPFFTFKLNDYNERDIDELKKFSKTVFDVDAILSTANRLKYTNLAKNAFSELVRDPDREFVKYLAQKFYEGRMTQPVLDDFAPIVRDAMSQYIREQLAHRLKSALENASGESKSEFSIEPVEVSDVIPSENDGIVTTQDEIDGYNIVRAILAGKINPGRVNMRDAKSYCAVLLDDNNRKPICRLRFNSKNLKRIGLFNEGAEKKFDIESLPDIFRFRDELIETIDMYEG